MVPEISRVYWFSPDDRPSDKLEGRQIMIFSKSELATKVITWNSEVGFDDDVVRWAEIPEWKPNTELVINRSFGRFRISDLCRQELGLAVSEQYPNYISDSEIRQNWRRNKKLIEAVKKLGPLASAPGSNLVVVEIPGCYSYSEMIISDRCGYESVEVVTEGVCEQ